MSTFYFDTLTEKNNIYSMNSYTERGERSRDGSWHSETSKAVQLLFAKVADCVSNECGDCFNRSTG